MIGFIRSVLLAVTVLAGAVWAQDEAAFDWEFEGAGSLEAALEKARTEGRPLLIGLSGGDT